MNSPNIGDYVVSKKARNPDCLYQLVWHFEYSNRFLLMMVTNGSGEDVRKEERLYWFSPKHIIKSERTA